MEHMCFSCYNKGVMGDVLEIAQYDQLTETRIRYYYWCANCPLKGATRSGKRAGLGDEGVVFIYEQV